MHVIPVRDVVEGCANVNADNVVVVGASNVIEVGTAPLAPFQFGGFVDEPSTPVPGKV